MWHFLLLAFFIIFAQKLQNAKNILTDPQQRADYDLWRRSGLAMPWVIFFRAAFLQHQLLVNLFSNLLRSIIFYRYEEWKARKDSIKMVRKTKAFLFLFFQQTNVAPIPQSMHWVVRSKKEPAIEAPPTTSSTTSMDNLPEKSLTSQQTALQEPRVYWTSSEGSETLRKFRNYEIWIWNDFPALLCI